MSVIDCNSFKEVPSYNIQKKKQFTSNERVPEVSLLTQDHIVMIFHDY